MNEIKKGRESARKKVKNLRNMRFFHIFLRHIGADEGTRTHMVSHRNLKPARLPVSPHPHIFLLTCLLRHPPSQQLPSHVVTPAAAPYTTLTLRNTQPSFRIKRVQIEINSTADFFNSPSALSIFQAVPPLEIAPRTVSFSIRIAELSSNP